MKKRRPEGRPFPGLFCYRIYAYLSLVSSYTFESHTAVRQSEKSIIFADAYIRARMQMRASLANQNVAGQNELTVSTLGAKALGLGITTVLRATYTFFTCHKKYLLTV